MSKRTRSRGKVGQSGGLAAVMAAALVLAAAFACAAQTQSADGTRASEKKAAAASSGEKSEAHADASKNTPAAAAAPKVGEAAPDFKLPYATQEKIFMKPEEQMSLSSLRGRNVVLAFYPADWSGGCTAEVCTFRDTFMEFGKLNATVLGISGDYAFSHHEWAKHHKLPFPLLSDHDHGVAKTYDSYNPGYGMNKRTVYLIDKEGVVRYSNLAFKAGDKKDYDALRAELEKLK
ncbi:MAG TPA: peroxiredoxin [Pyrinomonadaceae bacterium]